MSGKFIAENDMYPPGAGPDTGSSPAHRTRPFSTDLHIRACSGRPAA